MNKTSRFTSEQLHLYIVRYPLSAQIPLHVRPHPLTLVTLSLFIHSMGSRMESTPTYLSLKPNPCRPSGAPNNFHFSPLRIITPYMYILRSGSLL